ncbi:MAG: bi-domain-containing oxidoreductase [Candidatus Omnitrophica bacterium]|nr:bi-domain-containing oxidoreductase [Candidatus Omnitrophota bacterium]
MKKLTQNLKTGKLELKEVPADLCKDDGILVKTKNSLVSAGTEQAIINLGKASLAGKAKKRPDLVKEVLNKMRYEGVLSTVKKVFSKLDEAMDLGYSCAGEVTEIGENIDEFEIGDRVACAGSGYATHAELNFVPKNLCVKIPENVTFQEASFTTVGAIAMQGIRRCELNPGERVGVIGLGLIGQLTAQILSAYGFPVFGMDIDQKKAEKALKSGISKVGVIGKDNIEESVSCFTNGYGLDAVIITASTKSNQPLELAGKICRKRGKVSSVGLTGMEIPRKIYYQKELDFRISCSYGPGRYDLNYEEKGIDYPYAYVRWTEKRNMEECLRLISIGKIDIKSMITHKFKLENYKKAYDLILNNPHNEAYVGILFEYDTNKEYNSVVKFRDNKRGESTDIVNAGVIGCGNFAKSILLPNLSKLKNINIAAVATATGKNAEHIGKKYRCQYCTTAYQKILDDSKINTVFISTRHNLHAKLAIEALKKGKNVFVEKPLCITKTELQKIVSLFSHEPSAMSHQPILMVGFNRRFAPAIIKAKEKFSNRNTPLMINYRINAGYIPKEHWVHDSKSGGGRIIGEVCHFIDLLQFLTESFPVKLYANHLPPKGNILLDDNLAINIEFSDGSCGNIIYSALGDKNLGKEYIEIFGDKKSFVIDDFKTSKFSLAQNKGHFKELEAFIKAILLGRSSPISPKELLLSTFATFRINDSLRLHQPVDLKLNNVVE